jgi:hypothetical protein
VPPLLRQPPPLRRLLLATLLLVTACGGGGADRVGQPDQPGRAVLALDAGTGRLLWRKDLTPAAATEPVLIAGVALVPDPSGLVAYDARTGDRLWSLGGVDPLPQEAGDLLVVRRPGEVVAVEPRSGRSVWRGAVEPDAQVFAGAGGVAVVRSGVPGPEAGPPDAARVEAPGEVRLLRLDGTQAWRVDVEGPAAYAHPGRDVVAVAGLRGDVVALSPTDGRQLWRTRSSPASLLAVAEGTVLARGDTGVVAYDARSGAQRWRQRTPASGAPLQVVGDRVLVVQHFEASPLLDLATGRVVDELAAVDVELFTLGQVLADLDEIRLDRGGRGWTSTVPTGDRPALWTDAAGDVVVAVASWGLPPTRD